MNDLLDYEYSLFIYTPTPLLETPHYFWHSDLELIYSHTYNLFSKEKQLDKGKQSTKRGSMKPITIQASINCKSTTRKTDL